MEIGHTVDQLDIDDVVKHIHRTRNIGSALGECSIIDERVINHWCDVENKVNHSLVEIIHRLSYNTERQSLMSLGGLITSEC